MKQIDRIKKFSDAFGPSGFEDAVIAYAQEEIRDICTCKEDHMRNLYMDLKGNTQGGVNIMLDAHSDEADSGNCLQQAGTFYECFRAGKGSGFCRCID